MKMRFFEEAKKESHLSDYNGQSLGSVAVYADKVILLDKEILKQGTAEEVYTSPEFQQVFGTGK